MITILCIAAVVIVAVLVAAVVVALSMDSAQAEIDDMKLDRERQ